MSNFDLPEGFVPPAPPTYATYIATRSPQWKFYTNMGHAKNAIYHAYGYANTPDYLILELVGGVWTVKYRIKPGSNWSTMPWNDPNYKESETPRADRIEFLENKAYGLKSELQEVESELETLRGI